MRSLAAAFVILLCIHLLAGIGFIGWLGATDRVNGHRVQQVVDIFQPTVAEQAQRQAEAEAAEAEAAEVRDKLLRLEEVAAGPRTLEDRLAENFAADEFDLHRLERLQAETDAIRRRLDQDKQLIEKQLAELEAERAVFDEMFAKRSEEMQDEDFRRAVKTLEQLPPRQARGVVDQYIAAGQLDDAVDYLAAMQLRKSAAILKNYKTDAEIAQATDLIEKLRTRGVDPTGGVTAAAPMESFP